MRIVQISAGRERSVALAADGRAHAWGGVRLLGAQLPPGYPGELCTSNPTEIGHNRYAQPLPQLLNPHQPFSALADGEVETLAVTRAAQVWACRPVVADGKGAQAHRIAGLPADVAQVAATETAGLARAADGSVWSWGRSAPARVALPVPAAQIAAGAGHVLALDRRGAVWAWGANAAGQLGNGQLQSDPTPRKLALPVRIRAVAAGDTHSLALDEAGHLWGWGANNHGQLADDSAPFHTRPRRLRTGFRVARVDGGMFYTAAASTDGEVFAWGWNGLGQLGRDGLANSARPLRVAGLKRITQVAAGGAHILVSDGEQVFAWGDNRNAHCGNFPSTRVQLAPHRVAIA